jgi:hypothetical protein
MWFALLEASLSNDLRFLIRLPEADPLRHREPRRYAF